MSLHHTRTNSPSKGSPIAVHPPHPPPIREEMVGWFRMILGHHLVVEIRKVPPTVPIILPTDRAGDVEEVVRAALKMNLKGTGIYFSLNPLVPSMLGACRYATDGDVERRTTLLVDCDPKRPADTSSTDAEKAASLAVALAIRDALRAEGWPEPILADSGNGYHLLYRIHLPAADQGLVKRCLEALAARFNTDAVSVDTTVSNPSRICKFYGSTTYKGKATPERPHRRSRVLEMPASFDDVPGELLEALADSLIIPDPKPSAFPTMTRTKGGPKAYGETRSTRYVTAALAGETEKMANAPDGERNNQLFKSTVSLAELIGPDLSEETVRQYMTNAAAAVKLEGREVPRTIESGIKKGLANPRRYPDNGQATGGGNPHRNGTPRQPPPNEPPRDRASDEELARRPRTDLGNAERLVARHGHDMRFCHPWGRWLVWDGRRWKTDDTGEARRRARNTVRAILGEARTIEDDEQRKEHAKWALVSEKRDKIAAMLHLAEAEEGIPILPKDIDADPWLFNCRNGTIDLKTGELRPPRREDLVTKLCDLDYEPAAPCPLWLGTLARFFGRADPERQAGLIDYWRRLCGYALTGVIRDHLMPIAYGKGSNGKSTILGTLMDVFGSDYAMKCPPDMLMAKKTDSHPTDRADLFGKRLVVALETESGRRLNETMVKELTGGDPIRARRMREDFWEFKPTHTLMMATNHKPVIRGTDTGIWRRLKLVPFTVRIDDKDALKDMPERLQAEWPGILAWCVEGCREWQERGLDSPKEVVEATKGYQAEQDVVGLFLDECTIQGPNLKTKASPLYERYKAWAEKCNEYAMSMKLFCEAIQEREFEKKVSNGKWYIGLDLVPEDGEKPREEGAF